MLDRVDFETQQEDLAISCLLEQDQKEILEQSDWENPRKQPKAKNQITSYLDLKMVRPRHLFHRNQPAKGLRSRYNPEMLQATVFDHHQRCKQEGNIDHNQKNQCSQEEKEGQYWCSKVNWTSVGFKEPANRINLNKKLSMGNEPQLIGSRRSYTRCQSYDKIMDSEYKTNLIYNILKAETERLKQQSTKLKNAFPHNVIGRSIDVLKNRNRKWAETKTNKVALQTHQTLNLSRYQQQSMRQALQKLWLQNYQQNESHIFSPDKKGQANRSSAIREILLKLDKNKAKEAPFQNNQTDYEKERSNLLTKSKKVQASHIPEKCLNAQVKSKMNQVNLNIEAERVYKSRSVNRKYVKKV